MPRSEAVTGGGGAGTVLTLSVPLSSGRPLRIAESLRMDRGESVVSTVDGFEWIESRDIRFESGRMRGGADAGSLSVVLSNGRMGLTGGTNRIGFTGSGKSLTLARGGGGGGGGSPAAEVDVIAGKTNPLLIVSLSLASSLAAVAGAVLPTS